MKQSSPKATIVIPCYNQGQYLDESIDSVLKQTYKDHEIIVVNDASTEEKTIEILEKAKVKYPTVKLINHLKNRGLSAARNTGVEAAKGEYIACLDADDKYDPTFLEKMVKILENDQKREIGVVTPWVKNFEANNNIWETSDYDPIAILSHNMLAVASIFRKEAWKAYGGYKENMKGGFEDWDFWIGLTEKGYSWKLVPEPLLYYRVKEESMFTEAAKMHTKLYKRILENHPKLYQKYWKEVIIARTNQWAERESYIEELRKWAETEEKEIKNQAKYIKELETELTKKKEELLAIKNSRSWKLIQKTRTVLRKNG